MINLLEETLRKLNNNDKAEEDVWWVGVQEVWFTWEDFKESADTEYDNGFGAAQVAQDLIIAGENWWMERHEYDGAEWWEFKVMPGKPPLYKRPKVLTVGQYEKLMDKCRTGWVDLAEINDW